MGRELLGIMYGALCKGLPHSFINLEIETISALTIWLRRSSKKALFPKVTGRGNMERCPCCGASYQKIITPQD